MSYDLPEPDEPEEDTSPPARPVFIRYWHYRTFTKDKQGNNLARPACLPGINDYDIFKGRAYQMVTRVEKVDCPHCKARMGLT